MITNFINEYPYTNLTYANIDWLIKKVKELSGDTEDTDAGIQAFLGAYANEYPYSSLTYANIDWLIKNVGGLDAEVTKLSAQMETLQADVDNVVNKLGDKVDKLNVKNNVYVTDGSTPPKTTGIAYSELPVEGTIPIRDGIGSIQVPVAKNATQAVNKEQLDVRLDGKVDKTTESARIYGTDGNGMPFLYTQTATDITLYSVPLRNENGAIVANRAEQDMELVPLIQMNTALAGKLDKTTEPEKIYGTNSNGDQYLLSINTNLPAAWSVPRRNGNGAIVAANPTQNNELTTKEYVDNAIATAPTGGWTTVIDKTWTEDETTDYRIDIDIPAEYQKAMSELRMTYYNDTPQAGAIYSNPFVIIRLYDGVNGRRFMVTGNILPTQDTKEVTVNFVGDTNKKSTVLSIGSSDLFNECYGVYVYKDANGNAVQPIPTDPNALLNTSKIIGIAEGNQETVEYILNTCLPNRSHYYTTTSTQTTVNYTSNDYYNDQLPECIISQVLTSTDTTNLPVGAFICVQRRDLKFALNISIVFTSTASVSYKNVVTRQASIVGEAFQVIAGAESIQNTMTSFNDTSDAINGNPLPANCAYYSYLKNGCPTKVYIYPQSSTSNGVTAKKIYAGSRLVLQVRY